MYVGTDRTVRWFITILKYPLGLSWMTWRSMTPSPWVFHHSILLSLTCNISLWQLLWTACVIDLSLVNISTYWTSTRQRLVSRLLVLSKSFIGVFASCASHQRRPFAIRAQSLSRSSLLPLVICSKRDRLTSPRVSTKFSSIGAYHRLISI